MKLSVILPAYNEAENVKRFPTELVPYLDQLDLEYEIILIDDGSNDGTPEAAEALQIPQLRIVRHDQNRGVGAAVRTGIGSATGELLVMLDTDLTFHPRYIQDLLTRFNQNDVDFIIGSPRLASFSREIQWYRRFISICAGKVYSLLLGRRITAVTPIFRLYRTKDLKDLMLEAEKFDITVEILFKLISEGKRYAEVPVPLEVRKFGESKLDYHREIVRHAKMILRIIKWRIEHLIKRK